MRLGPKIGQVTVSTLGTGVCGRERAQRFTDVGKPGRAGEGEPRGARLACQGHHGAQQRLLCRRDPPPDPPSLRKQPLRKTGDGTSPTFPAEDVGGVIAGSKERAGSPRGTKPAASRSLAKLSPQPRGCPANPATVRRQNPKAALDRISILGGGDRPAAPLPGSLYLERPEAQGRENAETARVQALGGQDPQPRGALRAHPPASPKASGRCSPSGCPKRAPRASGTTVPGVHRAGPRAGAGRGLRGTRSYPSPRGPRVPSPAPRGLRGKPSRMVEATHRCRGSRGGRSSKNSRLRSSQSRVCQKEAGRLWSGAEARGVTARGGTMRSEAGP